MAFFFRNKTKSGPELAKGIKDSVQRLVAEEPVTQKTGEEVARCLAQMKMLIQGTPEEPAGLEQVFHSVQALATEDLFLLLAQHIHRLPFEARKDVQMIFSAAFRYRPPESAALPEPDVLHWVVTQRREIIVELCNGYRYRESASQCGSVLREAIKFEAVAELVLYDGDAEGSAATRPSDAAQQQTQRSGVFWRFFDWIADSAFEISADAFNTFRDLLTKHKELVAQFLEQNFDDFFAIYHARLVVPNNYVTKRQSIKLLGELLLERSNYKIMTRYVADAEHLKLVMGQLREPAGMIKFETFHVFKIFVANPDKSVGVQKILILNRDKLLKFLANFCEERNEDLQFMDEKSFLIRHLEMLNKQPVQPKAAVVPLG